MNISEKLLTLRKQHNLSQEDLAEKLGVSRQAISRWETEQVLPDTANIIRLSKLYHVSADYLLNDEYEEENDIPVVKRAEDRATKSSFMQMSYILSSAMNIISLLTGIAGYFISKSVAIVLVSMVIAIISISCFEASLVKYCEDGKNIYRKKYYDITVWIVCFIPVCSIFTVIYPFITSHQSIFSSDISSAAKVIAAPVVFAAVYVPVCLVLKAFVISKCR